MTDSKMGLWRVSGSGAGFGGELVRVDMEEVEMSTFVCWDVV